MKFKPITDLIVNMQHFVEGGTVDVLFERENGPITGVDVAEAEGWDLAAGCERGQCLTHNADHLRTELLLVNN